jgi:hypothetical protein
MSYVIEVTEESNMELVEMYEHTLYLETLIQHLAFIPSIIDLPTRQRQLELELESLQNFLRLVSNPRGIHRDWGDEEEMTPAEELKMELAYGCHNQTDIRLEDTAVAVKGASCSKKEKKRDHKKQRQQQVVDYGIRTNTTGHTKGQLSAKEDAKFSRILKKEQLNKWNKQKALNSKAKVSRRFAKYVDSIEELPAAEEVKLIDDYITEEEFLAFKVSLEDYEQQQEEEEDSDYHKFLAEKKERHFQKVIKNVRYQLVA